MRFLYVLLLFCVRTGGHTGPPLQFISCAFIACLVFCCRRVNDQRTFTFKFCVAKLIARWSVLSHSRFVHCLGVRQ